MGATDGEDADRNKGTLPLGPLQNQCHILLALRPGFGVALRVTYGKGMLTLWAP